MGVPIQNIYYLLCYAWDHLEYESLVPAAALKGDRVEDLLGAVLVEGVSRLLRNGLDQGYVPYEEVGRRLRGKVLFTDTLSRLLLQQGQVACQVDELSRDIPHNRVIKAAMRTLAECESLNDGIRLGLRRHCRALADVADIDLNAAAFRSIQLHRNIARYGFLMNICRLVAISFFPDQASGRSRFHAFTADDREMGLLFEAFVRNFLKREQTAFDTVAAEHVPWNVSPDHESDVEWLPTMKTDVTLKNAGQRVVIETKCSTNPYQEHYGRKKLISGHLYQLTSYVSHLTATEGPRPSGVLLYAGMGPGENVAYRLNGHLIRVRNLNLDQEWGGIRRDLLGLVDELRTSPN